MVAPHPPGIHLSKPVHQATSSQSPLRLSRLENTPIKHHTSPWSAPTGNKADISLTKHNSGFKLQLQGNISESEHIAGPGDDQLSSDDSDSEDGSDAGWGGTIGEGEREQEDANEGYEGCSEFCRAVAMAAITASSTANMESDSEVVVTICCLPPIFSFVFCLCPSSSVFLRTLIRYWLNPITILSSHSRLPSLSYGRLYIPLPSISF